MEKTKSKIGCVKCGSKNLMSTRAIADFEWSACKDCGYSPEYPTRKVVGWNDNLGLPIFENQLNSLKKLLSGEGWGNDGLDAIVIWGFNDGVKDDFDEDDY